MSAAKRGKRGHNDPDCIACTDPEKAAQARERRRGQIEVMAEKARAHRVEGERIRTEEYRTADTGSPEFADAQGRMLHHLGTANGMFQQVMMWRAGLERIEAAHGIGEATP